MRVNNKIIQSKWIDKNKKKDIPRKNIKKIIYHGILQI